MPIPPGGAPSRGFGALRRTENGVGVATITVIDDDAGQRTLLALHLERAGHTVLVERNGRAGLEAVRRWPPDLLVLDWMMPRMTGPEVCAALRAEARFAALPILMVTARVLREDLEHARHLGVDEVLTKPLRAADLLAAVDRLVPAG